VEDARVGVEEEKWVIFLNAGKSPSGTCLKGAQEQEQGSSAWLRCA